MNRRLFSAFLLPGLLLFLLLISVTGIIAAPAAQETVSEETAGEGLDTEPLPQPVQVTVQQRLPISADLSQLGIPTETLALPDAIELALDVTIEFVVSDTMTSTVSSTVTVAFAEDFLNSLPISLTVGGVTETLVVLMPQPAVEEAEAVTVTETVTTETPAAPAEEITATPPVTVSPPVTAAPPITTSPEVTVTPTVTPETEVQPVTATANVTANLRAGPSTDFELVGQAPLESELEIAGISEDAAWFLLTDSTWIFADLVDGAPADLPIATQALIDQVAADAAAQEEATEEPVEEAPPEETAADETAAEEPAAEEAADEGTAAEEPAEETAAEVEEPADVLRPTPEPEAEEPEATEPEATVPIANVDANLRAGPGTEYEIVGGTITGQELDITGQNEAGDWFLLSNGGWMADFLISNPPTDAPVVPDDASPFLTGEPAAPVLVPTPIPGQATETEAADDTADATGGDALGLAENLYLDEAETLVSRYQTTAEAVSQLAANAQADGALLSDDIWSGDISTAVATLQRSGQQIRALEPPPLFAAAHIDLRSAAESFDGVAAALEAALSEVSLEQLQVALDQIVTGNTQLQATQEKISTVAQ